MIPAVAHAAGTIRTMREEDRALLHERFSRAVTGVAEAHGCTGEYRVRRGEPPLVNDAGLAIRTRRWLSDFGLPTAGFASCGSDDFATYSAQVPILMEFVGTGEGPAGPMLHDASYLPADHVVREVALALLAGWLAGAEAALATRG